MPLYITVRQHWLLHNKYMPIVINACTVISKPSYQRKINPQTRWVQIAGLTRKAVSKVLEGKWRLWPNRAPFWITNHSPFNGFLYNVDIFPRLNNNTYSQAMTTSNMPNWSQWSHDYNVWIKIREKTIPGLIQSWNLRAVSHSRS